MSTLVFLNHSPIEATARARSATQPTSLYRPELDVLRFCAFLLVFMRHGVVVDTHGSVARHILLAQIVETLQGVGAFGLSLFFLLSSFLITTLLMLEREKTGTLHLSSFYKRRALRIWPLYFAFLPCMWLLGQVWEPAHFSLHALTAFSCLSANWYNIAAPGAPVTILFLWSISVEEQFYLLWPPLVRKLSQRGLARCCWVLLVVGLASTYALASRGETLGEIWFNTATETCFFAAGGILALRLGLKRQNKSGKTALGAVAFTLLTWIAAKLIAGPDMVDGRIEAWHLPFMYGLIVIGCCSLLYGFLRMPSSCLLRPFVYLGRISYGLYVFHGLALLAVPALLGSYLPHGGVWLALVLLVSFFCAMTSYELYEKSFLQRKERLAIVQSRCA